MSDQSSGKVTWRNKSSDRKVNTDGKTGGFKTGYCCEE